MSKSEEIYYSYKNKKEVYYLTENEESKLFELKYEFLKTLNPEQLREFAKLEQSFIGYKDALIKEIINYSISFNE